jgi:hypothetical protein
MLARNEGTLEPGNWDAPIHPNQQVNLPPTAIKVFLGPVLTSSDKFPSPIIRVRGEPLFVVDRQKNSHLRITLLKVFDTRNDIIARIDDTGFWVSPGSRKSRPDKSTLIVFDNRDTEVLNVRYLNKTTLSILGSFRYPNMPPVIIRPESLNLMGMTMGAGALVSSAGNPAIDVK